MTDSSVYERLGGMPYFVALVDRFYDGVETDSELRAMYPDDLEPGKQALAFFLGQYWGGPTTYSDTRGHPRLRMRHVNFSIGETEREAWLQHMTKALKDEPVGADIEQQMLDYFSMAAQHMINTQ